MKDFKVGEEIYMIDCILRRGTVVHNPFTDNLDFHAVDQEWENQAFRALDKRLEAIELMIGKLQELKEQLT